MVSAKSLPDFSHHVPYLPLDHLDSTVYFITKLSLDTLLQQTTNHRNISGLSRFSPPELSTPPPKVPPLNSCHFFSGALVSVNPLLVLATGGAVAALEQQWHNYYVLVDNTNVVPYGQLPTTYCSIVRIHRACKSYPLPTFGLTQWIILELSSPRNHAPVLTRPRFPTTEAVAPPNRSRSRSLHLTQQGSREPSKDEECVDPATVADNVFFDLARSYSRVGNAHLNGGSEAYFRQPPQQLMLSLVSLRTRHLFMPTKVASSITILLIFDAIPDAHAPTSPSPWQLQHDSGLLLAINDGEASHADPYLIANTSSDPSQASFTTGKFYKFTLSSGLAADGIHDELPALFHRLRLIRQAPCRWSAHDAKRVRPRAMVVVSDRSDTRLGFTLGPVLFENGGISGAEWEAEIPGLVSY